MSVEFEVYYGFGRAICKVCKKKIMKDELQVNAHSGRDHAWCTEGNAHFKCISELAIHAVKNKFKEERKVWETKRRR